MIKNNENYNIILKNGLIQIRKIKFESLYRISRDGNEYSTFHDLCDNKGATIILTKLKDSNILGNILH